MTDARRDELIQILRSGYGPSDDRCIAAAHEIARRGYAPKDDAENGVFAYAYFICEGKDTLDQLLQMTDSELRQFEATLRSLLTTR